MPRAEKIEYDVDEEKAVRETWFEHIEELNRHADICKQNKKLGREAELRTIAKQLTNLQKALPKYEEKGRGDYL